MHNGIFSLFNFQGKKCLNIGKMFDFHYFIFKEKNGYFNKHFKYFKSHNISCIARYFGKIYNAILYAQGVCLIGEQGLYNYLKFENKIN